jgi:hypothetical protein
MSRIESQSLDRARAIADARNIDIVDVVSAAVDLYDDVHGARVFLMSNPENDILTVDQARRRSRKGGAK